MVRHVIAALAPLAIMTSAPLLAQEVHEQAPPELEDSGRDFSDVARQLQDPEKQREMALMLRAVSEVLLDLPLAPMMEAMGEVSEDLTGEPAPGFDPDATLRSVAPQAERVPEEIEKNLPRALDAMGSMAQAFETMMPALADMAERMKDVVPQAE